MAELVIGSSIDTLARELEVVAVWNEAVAYTGQDQFSSKWIDENLGTWLFKMFGHDRVFVLNASDEPVYAMADGAQVDATRYAEVRDSIADMVADLRALGPKAVPHRATKTTGRGIHVADLRRVAGRPAVVGVMRIVPHAGDFPPALPGREALLLGVRFLDGSFQEELRTEHLLDGARFGGASDAGPGERLLPLHGRRGVLADYLIWRPEAPGAQILGHLIPLYLLESACFILIMLVLLRVLWRSAGELRASEAQAQHLAYHDMLTGHPNRAQLMDMLDQSLAGAARAPDGPQERFALLLLDLDRFKQVNDALGHQAGDGLIRQFADRLSTVVRRGDLVARLGGDEFAIVQHGITGQSDTEALCRRILDSVCRPFSLAGGMQASVGVSIGIATAPEAGLDSIGLMRKADIALYRAKAQGRNRFCFFADDMDDEVRNRNRLEVDLRRALETGEGLVVHYQPQMSCDGRCVTGLEALVRWQHPMLGLLPPSQFLSVADECGLSVRIDDWVLEHTCQVMERLPEVPVAVNLSPAQFYTGDLFERVTDIVRRHGVDPARIELEITERVLLEDNASSHGALRRLREAGFRIALDDFGTGYSSLSYLRRFRVDKIKIDQSFVRHLDHSQEASCIVRAIVSLGQAMGLDVTAEGVETEDQLRYLALLGCDQMQGYLFSPPVPEPGLTALGLTTMRQAMEAAFPAVESG
ncbi:putative bifunctional diguanylate cyclase/phosphodiesterase [Azospirillum thermophilum]|nr:EAL domain-containing protein [Azospirillum thermophilum]